MTDVLILEDELTSLQALSEILTTYSDDIRVHKASSLKEAKDLLDAGFVEFFEKAAPANPLKAEYLLPIYIDELLHADKVSVKVLPTHDKWFGVTYAEDKQIVIDSFAKLVADGVYEKDLFSDLKK